MRARTSSTSFAGAGILAAIAASLCCILPVLALIAGVSGIASAFSWLEPARLYLIGLSILVLGFAWYQKLKPNAMNECGCETGEKGTPLLQSKTFLALVTAFAVAMMSFPYYAHIFFPKPESKILVVESGNIKQIHLNIAGMNCAACNEEVKHAVTQVPGTLSSTADYETGTATVTFDPSKTSIEEVIAAVNGTGYNVTHNTIENTTNHE